MELSSLFAIVLGAYGSLKFSDLTLDWVSLNFSSQIENIDDNYLKIASFAFTFLIIIVFVSVYWQRSYQSCQNGFFRFN